MPLGIAVGFVAVVAIVAIVTAIAANVRLARYERELLSHDEISRRLLTQVALSRELLEWQVANDFNTRRMELLATIHDLRPCGTGESPVEPLGGCPRAGIQVRAAAVAELAELEAEVREYPERWSNVSVDVETNLSHVDLRGADLREAKLEQVVLTNADLSGANLARADLSGAILDGAQLSNVDFEHADLEGASVRGANLEGAKLEFTELMQSDLEASNLQRAKLDGADLDQANLADANLRHAEGLTEGQLAAARNVPVSAWAVAGK